MTTIKRNELADAIDSLPEDWTLVACNNNKEPISASTGRLKKEWTTKFDSRELLKVSGYVKAVGVATGEPSSLLAIDFDGPLANESLKKLCGFGVEDLPPTVANSSGKPNRQKLFFSIVEQNLFPFICGIGSGTKDYPDLEILLTGRQAVVIGEHPETEGYFFLKGCSPDEIQVAEAPAWLIDALIVQDRSSNQDVPIADVDSSALRNIVDGLNPEDFGGYENWWKLLAAIKLADATIVGKAIAEDFSRRAPNFDARQFERQWKALKTKEQWFEKFPNKRPVTIMSFANKQIGHNGQQIKDNESATGQSGTEESSSEELTWTDADASFMALQSVRKKPTINNLLAFAQHLPLRWNELKRCAMLADETIEPTLARVYLAKHHGLDVRKEDAKDVFISVAQERPFNPVADFLNSLRDEELPLVTDEQLADCFGFHRDDSTSIGLMRVHLRACAKRGLHPGSKMDSLLIIKGKQGNRKSTALATLSPEISWYDETTRVSLDSRDSLSALNSSFIYEFSEIEKILTTADVAAFKSWITRQVDKYCEKYQTVSVDHIRRCCLFGTTNSESFLVDPTGARRFWICHNVKPANIDLLKQLRNAIWKQSMIEMEDGLDHFLDNDHSLMIDAMTRAQDSTITDPWEDQLIDKLKDISTVGFISSATLLQYVGRDMSKSHTGDYRRLSNVMARLGWSKARERIAGSKHPVAGFKNNEAPKEPDDGIPF